MTETEYQLFYQVPPQEYLRHVVQELNTQNPPARPPPSPSRSYYAPSTNNSTQTEEESNWPVPNLSSSIQTLVNRFNEVRRSECSFLFSDIRFTGNFCLIISSETSGDELFQRNRIHKLPLRWEEDGSNGNCIL